MIVLVMQTFLVGIQGNRLGIFASEQSSCTVETVASTRSLFRCRPLRTALRMGRQFVSPTVGASCFHDGIHYTKAVLSTLCVSTGDAENDSTYAVTL